MYVRTTQVLEVVIIVELNGWSGVTVQRHVVTTNLSTYVMSSMDKGFRSCWWLCRIMQADLASDNGGLARS